jgi:hypothetical protein
LKVVCDGPAHAYFKFEARFVCPSEARTFSHHVDPEDLKCPQTAITDHFPMAKNRGQSELMIVRHVIVVVRQMKKKKKNSN